MNREFRALAAVITVAMCLMLTHAAQGATQFYYDDFRLLPERPAGSDLNGSPVLFSNSGPQNWTSVSVYQGGSFSFAADNSGAGFLQPNDYHSSNLATLPFQLGAGVYNLSAELFPDYPQQHDTPLDSREYLSVGFYKNNQGGYLWYSSMTALSLNIGIDGSYGTVLNGMDVLAGSSGMIPSWDGVSPVLATLQVDTLNNTISAWLETSTMPQTKVLDSVDMASVNFDPSSVNYVGIGRDDWLGPNSSVTQFSLSATPEPATLSVLALCGLGMLRRRK